MFAANNVRPSRKPVRLISSNARIRNNWGDSTGSGTRWASPKATSSDHADRFIGEVA